MDKIKKVIEACAVEIMIGGGFFITGVLCLIAGAYDGAAVCAGVATVAGIIGRMQWKRRARPIANVTVRLNLVDESKAKPNRPKTKPATPRKVVKPKKKTASRK